MFYLGKVYWPNITEQMFIDRLNYGIKCRYLFIYRLRLDKKKTHFVRFFEISLI